MNVIFTIRDQAGQVTTESAEGDYEIVKTELSGRVPVGSKVIHIRTETVEEFQE